MKHVTDDLVGIVLGPFETLARVHNPGLNGGKVFLDIIKYYVSHFL